MCHLLGMDATAAQQNVEFCSTMSTVKQTKHFELRISISITTMAYIYLNSNIPVCSLPASIKLYNDFNNKLAHNHNNCLNVF